MPNKIAVFTTNRGGNYGSSLYLVTADWVFRCSGNTNGRQAETFARRRAITYTRPGAGFDFPALGLTPVEGEHTGNPVSAVLSDKAQLPQEAPASWVSTNGVSWATAAIEVLAAEAAAHTDMGRTGRFSRQVGQLGFTQD